MSNALSKFKYCAIAASGAILLSFGVTVTAREAITGGGLRSAAVGITLILTGTGLKVWSLNRLFDVLTSEELDRMGATTSARD